jgi:hypothetical protein
MRILVLLAVLTACGTPAGDPGRACTAIAALTGIAVRIAPSVAARFAGTTSLEACWGGACHTYPIVLSPETTATGSTCTGTGPNDACTARMQQTGGQTGFADIPGLTTAPVRVTFSGETVTVTPKLVYPNGPDCGASGPQANLVVDERGMR